MADDIDGAEPAPADPAPANPGAAGYVKLELPITPIPATFRPQAIRFPDGRTMIAFVICTSAGMQTVFYPVEVADKIAKAIHNQVLLAPTLEVPRGPLFVPGQG